MIVYHMKPKEHKTTVLSVTIHICGYTATHVIKPSRELKNNANLNKPLTHICKLHCCYFTLPIKPKSASQKGLIINNFKLALNWGLTIFTFSPFLKGKKHVHPL